MDAYLEFFFLYTLAPANLKSWVRPYLKYLKYLSVN